MLRILEAFSLSSRLNWLPRTCLVILVQWKMETDQTTIGSVVIHHQSPFYVLAQARRFTEFCKTRGCHHEAVLGEEQTAQLSDCLRLSSGRRSAVRCHPCCKMSCSNVHRMLAYAICVWLPLG